MTKRVLSQVQASEMCFFFLGIEVVALFNKMRSSEIQKSLNIEPLLLRIKKSQLRWFGSVRRIPQERLPKQALLAKANGRISVGQLKLDGPTTLRIFDRIDWDLPKKMMEVVKDCEVWRLNLELLPPQPSRKSGQ